MPNAHFDYVSGSALSRLAVISGESASKSDCFFAKNNIFTCKNSFHRQSAVPLSFARPSGASMREATVCAN